jgi:xylan 1,4-beta-xylosidase
MTNIIRNPILRGFNPDPSDGKKYLLNMLRDLRPGQNRFAGIVMQEFSAAQHRLSSRP